MHREMPRDLNLGFRMNERTSRDSGTENPQDEQTQRVEKLGSPMSKGRTKLISIMPKPNEPTMAMGFYKDWFEFLGSREYFSMLSAV